MDFNSRRTLYQSIPVDMNMIKEFNNKYEAYKQLRLKNGDYDLYNEQPSEPSYRSTREDFDDEIPEPPKEDLEEELYLTRKRQRIKFQYLRHIDPNAKLVLPLKHDKMNILAPKKINSVVENFKARSKEILPPIHPSTARGFQPTEFLKTKNNPNVIKKKAQGMAIFRLKEGLDNNVRKSNFLETGIPEYDKQGYKTARSVPRKSLYPLTLKLKDSGLLKITDTGDGRRSVETTKSKHSILPIKTPAKRSFYIKEAKTAR